MLKRRSFFIPPVWVLLALFWSQFLLLWAQQPPIAGGKFPVSNTLSVMVINIDPWVSGKGPLNHELAEYVQTQFLQPAEAPLGKLISLRGGSWRIIETARLIQVGLFLPGPSSDYDEAIVAFLKRIGEGLSQVRKKEGLPSSLTDQLMGKILNDGLISRGSRSPNVSLWLGGPMAQSEQRFKQEIEKWSFGETSLQASSEPPDLFSNGPESKLVRIAVWDKPGISSLVSAKFLGERATNHQLRSPWTYDVWLFPEQVVLILVGDSSLNQLYDLQQQAEQFFDGPAVKTPAEKWELFAASWKQTIQTESRLLEKGAFLRAMENHFGFGWQASGTFSYVAPTTRKNYVCLPDRRLHGLIHESTLNPRCVVIRSSDPSGRVDLTFGLKGTPEFQKTVQEKLEDSVSMGGILFDSSPTIPDYLFFHADVSTDQIVPLISQLRSFILSCVIPVASKPENSSVVLPEKPIMVIAAASSLPTFELLGKIRQAWPGETLLKAGETPLNLQMFVKSVDCTSIIQANSATQSAFLKGRWETRSATPAGVSDVLAKLVAQGAVLQEVSEIPRLLGFP